MRTCAWTRWEMSFVLLLAAGSAAAQDQAPAAAALAAFQAAGRQAPMTLHPVRVLERPDQQVAEALGLVLERRGMPELEVAADSFAPPAGAEWPAIAAAFAAHQRAQARTGRYHLYAEFLGTPRTGPQEVRFVVVDGGGTVVLCDRQMPADADFARTAGRDQDPLGCATLVAERLFALTGWQQAPGAVQDGRFAARWRERSGVPAAREVAAMRQRAAALRAGLATARIAVLPVLFGGKPDAGSSARLAARLGAQCSGKVQALADAKPLAVAPTSNEQRRLWDLMRALQGSARAAKADADYLLAADIGLDPESGSGFVHIAVCTAAGEPVLAELVNDQQPLFARLRPQTLEQAERLAAERLAELWR